jgi:hypothetical protein
VCLFLETDNCYNPTFQVCEGAALWGEWKVYAVCSLQNVFSKECVY